jgi:hypothetical protein
MDLGASGSSAAAAVLRALSLGAGVLGVLAAAAYCIWLSDACG